VNERERGKENDVYPEIMIWKGRTIMTEKSGNRKDGKGSKGKGRGAGKEKIMQGVEAVKGKWEKVEGVG
jgi:hypothetical protein